MSGGGGGNTTTTVVNESISKEYAPYFKDVLDRAGALSNEEYIPYSGKRLADMAPETLKAYGMIDDMASNGMAATRDAIGMTSGLAGLVDGAGAGGPYKFSEFGYSDPGTFDASTANRYMSPFMQAVVDAQKKAALEDYQIANQARAAQAVQANAFGGSRAAVQQGLAERDLLSRTNQIQSEGLQKSYEDAQRMFEADRAARMASERDRAAELSRVQSGQSAENLNYANLTLDKVRSSAALADQISVLEGRARAGDIEAARLLEAAGKAKTAYDQAGKDLSYEDFLRQLGYPMDRLKDYASILHGSPVANATTTSTSVPYNPIQQALGMGISALGLYNAMGAA